MPLRDLFVQSKQNKLKAQKTRIIREQMSNEGKIYRLVLNIKTGFTQAENLTYIRTKRAIKY